MDYTLGYLRESLSNHLEDQYGKSIYKKMLVNHYENEEEFVRDLDELEITFLNKVLKKEIRYAMEEQDEKRTKELNEVYELLF
ncbi:sigma-G-dependent sporulation-specific acid-soluble spore protein CsgA [Heyndrickxia acidicola]|uniref:Sigma-G-dependent sporulation-specific acid-soluble spore protein CsgA n=1 Tax=Heyndrickxia acidicola TaxID=209389 RepID=A0ABU6MEZ8_9BACI|nr:sigma-G-dependent sporulation-specific acid-soluble spore protein CsgA [Heyndrickxia acidicola]MED1201615.1 sigma-G-dependent sporulation-specific acid-soluble spore protein CsgA [Heyndrickxia acidicola]